VEVEGLTDFSGYIDEFIDITTESVNETLTPGGQFSNGATFLKEPRTLTFAGGLTVPATP
jgi:hypothetical protein